MREILTEAPSVGLYTSGGVGVAAGQSSKRAGRRRGLKDSRHLVRSVDPFRLRVYYLLRPKDVVKLVRMGQGAPIITAEEMSLYSTHAELFSIILPKRRCCDVLATRMIHRYILPIYVGSIKDSNFSAAKGHQVAVRDHPQTPSRITP